LGDEGVEMNGQDLSRSSTPKPAAKKRGRPAKVKEEEESPLKKKGKTADVKTEEGKPAPRKRAQKKVKAGPAVENGETAEPSTPADDENTVKVE
jgi:hypothetical protein